MRILRRVYGHGASFWVVGAAGERIERVRAESVFSPHPLVVVRRDRSRLITYYKKPKARGVEKCNEWKKYVYFFGKMMKSPMEMDAMGCNEERRNGIDGRWDLGGKTPSPRLS